MISLRTLVNTTIFWFLSFIIFWGYTKWFDDTPAKELIHAIGWDNLGNLTITTTEGLTIDSESTLIQKIDNMEKMIQTTNMNCSLLQLNTSNNSLATNLTTIPTNLNTNTTIGQTIAVPVFSTIINAQLPSDEQATAKSLTMIQRQVAINNPSITDIFNLVTSLSLTNAEQSQGLINVFSTIAIGLSNYTINDSTLTLTLSGISNLSTSQQQLINAIFEKTYTQFPQITNVIIQ